jgi:hypothetical protein
MSHPSKIKSMNNTTTMTMMRFAVPLLAIITVAHGWVTPTSPIISSRRSASSALGLVPSAELLDGVSTAAAAAFTTTTTTMWVSASEEITGLRQYVPLVVSLLVIIDIALGRPLANSILAPLQGVKDELSQEPQEKNLKERVDTNAIAQEALDQARTMMELKEYLDTNKTDAQKLQELRDKMDKDMQQVDQVLQARQEKLDAGEY